MTSVDKSVEFYTKVLGLKLALRIPGKFEFAVIEAPGTTIGLNPIQRNLQPGRCESLSIGFGVESLEKSMEELKSKGVQFDNDIIIEGPVKIVRFTDPDKNPLYLIETTQDPQIKQ